VASSRRRDAQVAAHFDVEARSGRWDALYEEVGPRTYQFHVRRDRVLELLPPHLGHVLDVGCGTGILAGPVLARGGTYLGIDVSPGMIEEARARGAGLSGATFRVGNIEALPLGDGSVDQVICLAVIEYLATPDRALTEIARVLRPGGIAIVTAPKRIHLEGVMLALTSPLRRVARAVVGKRAPDVRRIGYQPSELDRHARAAGLLPDGGSHYYFTPVAYPFTRAFPRLAMRLDLPFERWHATHNPLVGFLAQGYVARYRRPAAA